MDKKYNGFNNGRDRSDGVGGREVNHGTKPEMTKEQILESRISCTCDEAYKSRKMADPDCGRCNWYEEILQCMSEWESQQLSAEREAHKKEIERILSAVARGENLANSLNFDGKSELDKERERAGKLVEVLKHCEYWMSACMSDFVIPIHLYTEIKQTLNEYEKES